MEEPISFHWRSCAELPNADIGQVYSIVIALGRLIVMVVKGQEIMIEKARCAPVL